VPSDTECDAYCGRHTGRGAPLVPKRAVRGDERGGTELESAPARAERAAVEGVVPDRVEEPRDSCVRGRIVPGDW
jgi:hypothetical protein